MVEAVTIHDEPLPDAGGAWAVDLPAILCACGPEAMASAWQVSDIDCDGPLAAEFIRLGAAGAVLGWAELQRLLAGVTQVLSGDFEARRADGDRPWLVVKAIRGRECVVVTTAAGLIGRLRTRFRDVRPSPEDAGWLAEPGAAPDRGGT